jgi:hypothetical protein
MPLQLDVCKHEERERTRPSLSKALTWKLVFAAEYSSRRTKKAALIINDYGKS